jgi:hypothetical protein
MRRAVSERPWPGGVQSGFLVSTVSPSRTSSACRSVSGP